MFKIYSNSVLASEVAEFLKRDLNGDNVVVYGPSTLDKISDNCLICAEDKSVLSSEEIKKHAEVLILCKDSLGVKAPAAFIVTPTPQLDFIRVVNQYFTRPVKPCIHTNAVIEEGSSLGKDVSIYAGSYIGPEVEIGDNTIIFQNVVIMGKVKIGKNCVVKANSTIGSEIFDFVYGENGWKQFPQIGKIIVKDNVWVGANTTIEKGSLCDTVIESGVKIDDLVQIGSGSVIGQDTIVAAGTVVCSEVKVGRKCWIAPHVSILQRLSVGDGSMVGLGSVVIKDVPKGSTVVGNPAKPIKRAKSIKGESRNGRR